MPLPFINGVQYHWGQVVITALGNAFVGVEKISYEENQDMELNYGAGNYALGMGFGKIDAKGSITLYQEELEALQNAAPDRRLQAIPNFDITITYLVEPGQLPVKHVIRNVRFKNNKRDLSQGDTKVVADIEFIASHIDY